MIKWKNDDYFNYRSLSSLKKETNLENGMFSDTATQGTAAPPKPGKKTKKATVPDC